jgi:single-stranded DNA-binding protein
MDVNRGLLTGVVVSAPYTTTVSKNTFFASFELQVNEVYRDANGRDKVKPNIFVIETLGRKAMQVKDMVKVNRRYVVDGYLRQDIINGVNKVRIRAFAVLPEKSDTARSYYDGVRRALSIIAKADDAAAAAEELERILKPTSSRN